ncbi:MAG: phosphoadenylyl-sulfate reductase, partial [Thermoleophilia bacterium]|nr:phosphoadenylyl-sulfate reductase [Thermoleophilia bacterium]
MGDRQVKIMMSKKKLTEAQVEALSEEFESATPQEIVAWAVETFCPRMALSSSFQTYSVPLIDMVRKIHPEMRIFFLETGYHFWDTLVFREKLGQEWGMNIVDLRHDVSWSYFLRRFGRDLPDTDPGLCCYIRKVQPMQLAMDQLEAWITGIRRDQTENRANARILEYKRDGLLRIAPMLNWTKVDVEAYILAHDLPRHPMPADEYPSVGCKPCT